MTGTGSLVTPHYDLVVAGTRDCQSTSEVAGWVTCAQNNPTSSLSSGNKYSVKHQVEGKK